MIRASSVSVTSRNERSTLAEDSVQRKVLSGANIRHEIENAGNDFVGVDDTTPRRLPRAWPGPGRRRSPMNCRRVEERRRARDVVMPTARSATFQQKRARPELRDAHALRNQT